MHKVVVMGGAGFVGSHVADILSERGYKVTIFDRVPSPWLRDDQEMVVGRRARSCRLFPMSCSGARYLYHFAGIADIGEAKERPFETVSLNVMGTTTAAQAAVEARMSIGLSMHQQCMFTALLDRFIAPANRLQRR